MPINRVAFTIGGLSVYWYGITMAIAMVSAVVTASARQKGEGFPRDTVTDFAFWAIPLALVCARLYYVVFEWPQFADAPLRIFDVRSGGMAIYGGILGGVLAGLLFCRRRKLRFLHLADLIAPSLALGQGIGRWGNFCNQEAYGRAVLSPAFQWFPASVYIQANASWHMATFFYESIWCIGLWLLLEILSRRGFFRKRRHGDGLAWYALFYGAERAFVEGLRTDSLYAGGIRISQAISLLLIAALLLWFFFRSGRRAALPWCIGCAATLFSLALSFGLPLPDFWMLPCNLLALIGGVWQYRLIPLAHELPHESEA